MKTKKLLSVFLCVAIIMCMAPLNGLVGLNFGGWLPAFKAVAASNQGSCGNGVTWKYDESTFTLTIRGSGNVNYSDYQAPPWSAFKKSIKHVKINSGVLSILDYAFKDYKSIEDVTIEDGLTYIKSSVFQGCTALTDVVLPDSLVFIGSSAFSGCTGLTSLRLPDGLETIRQSAFIGCTSLADISFPDSVNFIEQGVLWNTAFFANQDNWDDGVLYCGHSLIEAKNTIPSVYHVLNGTKCIANSAFYRKSNLSAIDFPDGLVAIGQSAFDECTALENIAIPGSLRYMSKRAFADCTSLKTVTVAEGVQEIGLDVFSGCSALESVSLPDSLLRIYERAFTNCIKLESIVIPDSVNTIRDSAFYGCKNLTDLTLGNGIVTIYDYVFYGCDGLTSVVLTDSVESIGKEVFGYCENLKEVYIGKSVSAIGERVFDLCANIEKIEVDPANTTYHSDGNCLIHNETKTLVYGCKTSVIPNDGSVTAIGAFAFSRCRDLENIDLPDTINAIGKAAFWDCVSLAELTIPASVVTISESAFSGCTGLKSVEIENGVQKIDNSAFSHCDGVDELTVPDTVVSIGYSAFMNIPNVIYHGTSTGEPWGAKCINGFVSDGLIYADSSMKELVTCNNQITDTVIIPDGVEIIKSSAFKGAANLAVIYLPLSLKEVESFVFDNTSLHDVYYSGTEEDQQEIAIQNYNQPLNDAIWHYSEPIIDPNKEDTILIKEATCQQTGILRHVYGDGRIVDEELPKVDHKFMLTETVPASCKSEGRKLYKCVWCDETHTETLPAQPNDHKPGKWLVVTEPNGENEGLCEQRCEVCGKQLGSYPVTSLDGEFAGGDGSMQNPYLIYTKEQFKNATEYDYYHYLLINDIDFAGDDTFRNFSHNSQFESSFNGGNHIVSNLTVTDGSVFGYNMYLIRDLTLKNLKVSGSYENGDWFLMLYGRDYSPRYPEMRYSTGGLVSFNEGTIINCHVEGVIDGTGSDFAGGIVGTSNGYYGSTGVIKDCSFYGTVYGASINGGIAGRNWGDKLINCVSAGTVGICEGETSGQINGGIVGVSYGLEITDCVNTAEVYSACDDDNAEPIISSFYEDYISGGIAGFVGYHRADLEPGYQGAGMWGPTISRCANLGKVTGAQQSGGIIGHAFFAKINDCYNAAEIDGRLAAGGLVGVNEICPIGSSYNAGAITTADGDKGALNGILGDDDAVDCYYLDNISVSNGSYADGQQHEETAVRCTGEQMETQSSFDGFDFNEVWTIGNVDGYTFPTLRSINAMLATDEPEPDARQVISVDRLGAAAYYNKENRDYKFTVNGKYDKLQVKNVATGGTHTYTRAQGAIVDNGDGTETWNLNLSLAAGDYDIVLKLGKTWLPDPYRYTVSYDESAVLSVSLKDSAPYYSQSPRDYSIIVKAPADKVQLQNVATGGTMTFTRTQAKSLTDNGDGTETWVLNFTLGEGDYVFRAKHGKVWAKQAVTYTVAFDELPAALVSFDVTLNGKTATYEAVTKADVEKIQLVLADGSTCTYTAAQKSVLGDDGLRHWTVLRTFPKSGSYETSLKLKFSGKWFSTDSSVTVDIP